MNLYTRICTLITILVLVSSCNETSKLSKKEQHYDSIMELVIQVHDEVMPKMGAINTLIDSLGTKIDTTAQGKSYATAQQDLKNAHDGMMTWMSEFSTAFPHEDTTMTDEQLMSKIILLQKEQDKVGTVKENINTSISNAEKLLETP